MVSLGVNIYTGASFLQLNIPRWVDQRNINREWVQTMVDEQLDYYHRYNTFLFPATFTVLHYHDQAYLIDGQHRVEALRLLAAQVDISTITVYVSQYRTDDYEQATGIYALLNRNYQNNPMLGNDKEPLRRLGELMTEAFPRQMDGGNFPNIDLNVFLERIGEAKFLEKYSVDEIFQRIVERNTQHGNYLKQISTERYKRCHLKSNFFLADLSAKCRWVSTLF